MTVFAVNGQIGATGLYLLFAWLISGALAATIAARKGYGERVGLTFGLLLSVIGLVIVLLLPGRPGSAWKREGPLPPGWRSWRNRGPTVVTDAPGAPPAGDTGSAGRAGGAGDGGAGGAGDRHS